MTHHCPVCGDYMHPDDPWRLRDGLDTGEPAHSGDYVHARCYDATNGGEEE